MKTVTIEMPASFPLYTRKGAKPINVETARFFPTPEIALTNLATINSWFKDSVFGSADTSPAEREERGHGALAARYAGAAMGSQDRTETEFRTILRDIVQRSCALTAGKRADVRKANEAGLSAIVDDTIKWGKILKLAKAQLKQREELAAL